MPKLNRWIKATKKVPVFSHDLVESLTSLGVALAGGEFTIEQTLHVNPHNREKVIALLLENGYEVHEPGENELPPAPPASV